MEEKIEINIQLSEKLLSDINKKIKGKNRNDKLIKCVELGIQELIERRKLDPNTTIKDLQTPMAFSEEISPSE